jgi:hypothetical protein
MSGSADGATAECESCGSTYFYEVQVQQYSKGYGSVEYTATSFSPKNVKICLCGTPLPLKSLGKSASSDIRLKQEELTRSLSAAKQHLKDNSAGAVVNEAVSPKELNDLRAEFESKLKAVNADDIKAFRTEVLAKLGELEEAKAKPKK